MLEADAAEQYDGAEFHLNFDPTVLQVTNLDVSAADAVLPVPLVNETFDNGNGTIDFAGGTLGPLRPATWCLQRSVST